MEKMEKKKKKKRKRKAEEENLKLELKRLEVAPDLHQSNTAAALSSDPGHDPT